MCEILPFVSAGYEIVVVCHMNRFLVFRKRLFTPNMSHYSQRFVSGIFDLVDAF